MIPLTQYMLFLNFMYSLNRKLVHKSATLTANITQYLHVRVYTYICVSWRDYRLRSTSLEFLSRLLLLSHEKVTLFHCSLYSLINSQSTHTHTHAYKHTHTQTRKHAFEMEPNDVYLTGNLIKLLGHILVKLALW